ncbi:MAG TPA: chlorite dismutase family protein [Acidimicrobiales bacterium]|nr:chlorite dismutase family protein [Acidimicrobiales bacterium]
MTEPLSPGVGWGVLHLFCHLTPTTDSQAVVSAVKAASADDHQVVTFAVLGHKADLGVMAIGPDLWRLRSLQADLRAAGLAIAGSYVSMTEVSEYAKGMPEKLLQDRLYPQLPPEGKRAVCFYPMSKRRGEGANWYRMSFEEREALMKEHGASGRRFAGRVTQLITGSTGLDHWEWGVTLFATDPADLKEVVYTMRFDEASAAFAEFGPFWTGLVADIDEILTTIKA